MTQTLSSTQVWQEIEKEMFCVLGMVTAQQEARTAGVVYVVRNGRFYISTGKQSWKARHVAANPHVSLTIPIAKRIPFLPWIKIPAATITCHGQAAVHDPDTIPADILQAIYRDAANDPARLADTCVIVVEPTGDFVTYGIGVTLQQMRDPAVARGRAPVSGNR